MRYRAVETVLDPAYVPNSPAILDLPRPEFIWCLLEFWSGLCARLSVNLNLLLQRGNSVVRFLLCASRLTRWRNEGYGALGEGSDGQAGIYAEVG